MHYQLLGLYASKELIQIGKETFTDIDTIHFISLLQIY